MRIDDHEDCLKPGGSVNDRPEYPGARQSIPEPVVRASGRVDIAMAYEEVLLPEPTAEDRTSSGASLFKTPLSSKVPLSAKALVRKAEYRVARALPRRVAETLLAEEMGVSVETLRAAFAHVYGASIYRSLLKLRVKLVDRVLDANADLNPRTIAEVCGFGYFGRFHQLYRRDTGRSPSPNPRCDPSHPEGLASARAALTVTVEQYFGEQYFGEAWS